ncbi:MAG: histidine kinase, partial [Coleofasciculus sp. S288]|nr:histidine kinase [Coleofasciculus sp. S288]
MELHYGGQEPYFWQDDDISVVEAIATQAGVALTQAQAYTDLAALNRQLEALERTQNNLIAIVGHELRTPLSTVQICLESLASEPDMALEVQQTMLETALGDAERLRNLIQDFLTLSRLESGQVHRHPESIQFQEALDLALSGLKTSYSQKSLPPIHVELPAQLPAVRADGDELVEVLTKLLDNACKFSDAEGEIIIQVQIRSTENNAAEDDVSGASLQENNHRNPMLEVIVADTGRGIEPSQLEAIFDCFYQEEGALRRTAGGTGLGLAICRRIVEGMGGQIWAESAGRDRGSQFHFTVPIEPSKAAMMA